MKPSRRSPRRKSYAVLVQPSSIAVKEWDFFKSQGGTTQQWGRRWKRVMAKSIGDARRRGFVLRDGKKAGETNAKAHRKFFGERL